MQCVFAIMLCFTTMDDHATIAAVRNHRPARTAFIARPEENLFYSAENCCGVVAAYIVLQHRRRGLSLEAIVDELPVSAGGTSMNELASFFESHGLQATPVDVSTSELHELLCRHPEISAIALMQNRHWSVAVPKEKGNFQIFDYPEWQPRNEMAFRRFFTGKALLIGDPENVSAVLGQPVSLLGSLAVPAALYLAVIVALAVLLERRRYLPVALGAYLPCRFR